MQNTTDVYLLTGSNIEPRLLYLRKATEMIDKEIGTLSKQSAIYESEPWGFSAAIPFLNQVLLIRTAMPADEILSRILEIEQRLGRQRSDGGYTSRTIDIDILYYGDEIIHNERLTVPHPRLHERKFTLMPLVEIAANFRHPVLKLSNTVLLEQSADHVKVKAYQDKNGI